MPHRTETRSGSGPSSRSGLRRANSSADHNAMTIPDLVSQLRDTFLASDFDRVEQALATRESRLSAEIEEKNREIESLRTNIEVQRLERINAELQLKSIKETAVKEEENHMLDLGPRVRETVCELCLELKRKSIEQKDAVDELRIKNSRLECEKIGLLDEKKKWDDERAAVAELHEENRRLLEAKRRAEASAESWKNNFRELKERVFRLESSIVNEKVLLEEGDGCSGKNNGDKETVVADVLELAPSKRNEDVGISLRKSPSIPSKDGLCGSVQPKELPVTSSRKVGTKINILEGLAGDASSCGSSSDDSLDMDNLPLSTLTSKKRMRTEPASLSPRKKMPRRRIKPDITLDSSKHIAYAILQRNAKAESRVLRPRHGNIEPPIRQIHPILREFGLYNICTFQAPRLSHQISAPLVSALVERWRPETHTFHLPHGECAVTLEDVSILLGLPINGLAASTDASSFNDITLSDMCRDYLGITPPPGALDKSFISLGWLDLHFRDYIRQDAHQFDEETVIQWHARGYILRLFGYVLFSEKHDVKVHGKYLAMLRDLDTAKNVSWGSAVLAVLDRSLCRATRTECAQMGGCLLLLVSWAYFRFPKFAPIFLDNDQADVYEFPLASRWNHSVGWRHNFRYKSLNEIRNGINMMQPNEFVWQQYRNPAIAACIPNNVSGMRVYWATVCPLICVEIVEWHAADHVMRQFGLQQLTPTNLGCNILGESHNRDLRRNPHGSVTNWMQEHARWHHMWMNRATLNGYPITMDDYSPSVEYWEWYNHNGRGLYLSTEFCIPHILSRPVPIVIYPWPSQHMPPPLP